MIKIIENDINDAFAKLDTSNENPFEGIFEQMDKQQPCIIDYLYEVEGDGLNKDERDLLLNVSIIAWYILNEKMEFDLKITSEQLDSQLERNTNLFDENDQNNDDLDEETTKLLSKFNMQPDLMEFLISLVLDMPQRYQWNIRKDRVLIILLHIKTVVDLLVNQNQDV